MEPDRLQLRNYTFLGLLGIATFPAILYIEWFAPGNAPDLLIKWHLPASIAGFFLLMLAQFKHKTYKKAYKHIIIREIFATIAPELEYSPSGFVPRHIYESSKLFPQLHSSYQGDDFLTGQMGKTDVMFSELHTELFEGGKDDSKRSTSIFRGFFFSADFHKETSGETYGLPDLAEKRLGLVGKFLQKKNPVKHAGKLIQLEDKAFEKEFVVYGTDQVEARYCLTPTMMKALLRLQRQFKSKVYVSFRHSRINISISSNKNNFEPRVWQSGIDPSMISQMRVLFTLLISIVEGLNLNTRIWGKKAS